MKYGYGIYHSSQEKQLLKERACNNLKIKVCKVIEYACILGAGVACLGLMCSAYLGV